MNGWLENGASFLGVLLVPTLVCIGANVAYGALGSGAPPSTTVQVAIPAAPEHAARRSPIMLADIDVLTTWSVVKLAQPDEAR